MFLCYRPCLLLSAFFPISFSAFPFSLFISPFPTFLYFYIFRYFICFLLSFASFLPIFSSISFLFLYILFSFFSFYLFSSHSLFMRSFNFSVYIHTFTLLAYLPGRHLNAAGSVRVLKRFVIRVRFVVPSVMDMRIILQSVWCTTVPISHYTRSFVLRWGSWSAYTFTFCSVKLMQRSYTYWSDV